MGGIGRIRFPISTTSRMGAQLAGRIGLWTLWVLEATSVVGAVVLRRRRVPISPLVALVITVTITTAITLRGDAISGDGGAGSALLAVVGMGWSGQQYPAPGPAWPACAGGTRDAGVFCVRCSVGAAAPGS